MALLGVIVCNYTDVCEYTCGLFNSPISGMPHLTCLAWSECWRKEGDLPLELVLSQGCSNRHAYTSAHACAQLLIPQTPTSPCMSPHDV